MAKVQITLDDELLKKVDDFANENFMTRSGLVSVAVNDYINAKEVGNLIKNMSIAVKKIAETGNIDDETMSQIEDFEKLTRLIYGGGFNVS